ncbi:hypothetical protein [Actinomadura kijaniata]|uniref:hypothetical protein n=1 Tax=Actinomadura kijaniata TaxID=46161 RepID=UPI0008379849|nr:hypothetical protein [Actinomadura kijaniata]
MERRPQEPDDNELGLVGGEAQPPVRDTVQPDGGAGGAGGGGDDADGTGASGPGSMGQDDEQ